MTKAATTDISEYVAQLGTDDGLSALGSRVADARRKAAESFATLGFPTSRDEDWRFTNISSALGTKYAVARGEFGEAARRTLDDAGIHHLDAYQAVFVNGHFAAELSDMQTLPKGVTFGTLGKPGKEHAATAEKHLAAWAKTDANAFAAWNTAGFVDGAVLHVAANVDVEKPVRLVFLSVSGSTAQVAQTRALVVVETGARLRLIESYAGNGGSEPVLTNSVVEIVVEPNATVDHYKVQRDSLGNFHVSTTQIQQERDSHYSHTAVSLGSSLARNDINLFIGGEGACGILNGMYLVGGTQLCDTHTRIDHAKPHCESHELYKGILDDSARGVFNGRIYVHQDAQKTDAKQTNQSLLLSDAAQINSNPQLEIFADDVKCTHGATIGQLEDEHVFYLQTRGISKADAKQLLTFAFANDIVQRIEIEALRINIERAVLAAQDVPVQLVLAGED